MELSQTDIKIYTTLFAGRRDAYGSFTITGRGEGGKLQGKASTIKSMLTDDIYVRHLRGSQGVGIIPIKENNKCSFAVIDVDTYTDVMKQRILRIVGAFNMPLCLFSSKSGGIHAYLFFRNEVTAKFAQSTMKRLRDLLGLPDNTEIFPKQERTEAGSNYGNWINLPYFEAGDNCLRNLLDETGKPVKDFTVAMNYCDARRFSEEDIQAFFENIPLQDAPPCLQQLYVTGVVTDRNNYLFSLGVYFKAKYGDDRAERELIEANKRLANPINAQELLSTVIASMKKKDYSYKCNDAPLCSLCNSEECGKRKFGIGGKEVSKLSFGEFRQIMSDPPTYEWDVNEKTLVLETEDDIINQNGFRKQCIRKLGIMVERMSEPRWQTMVSRALLNRKIVEVDPEMDVSQGAIIKMYIMDYIVKRSRVANNPQSILNGYVYFDRERQQYIFDPKNLVVWLTRTKELKGNNLSLQFKEKMQELKGTVVNYPVTEEQTMKCFAVPADSVKDTSKKVDRTADKIGFLEDFNAEALENGIL